MDYPRIPTFKTAESFRKHLEEINVDLEIDDTILSAPESPLAQSISYHGHNIGNRWCVLPMEGWDCLPNGAPSEYTRRRWMNFATSGAKLLFGCEACAVMKSGKSNTRQLMLTEETFEGMIEEAEALVSEFGATTYVKIPVTDVGLRVTKYLSDRGFGVTVTAVLTAAQALLASRAGATYVAPYISRSENLCADGVGTVADISEIFEKSKLNTQILAASFKTAKEVLDVAVAGCHAATVASDIMRMLISHTTTDTSILGFKRDWNRTFGEDTTLLKLLKK